jgi:hypothetical protein
MLDVPGKEEIKNYFEKILPIELNLYYPKSNYDYHHLKMIVE